MTRSDVWEESRTMRRSFAPLVALVLIAGCSDDGTSATPSPSATSPAPSPTPSPTYSVYVVARDFTAKVTNPWFPLPVGRTWEYRGTDEDGPVRELVTVTDETEK